MDVSMTYEICVFFLIFGIIAEWLIRKLKISNYDARYVLITGCDTGFGNGLAKRLDKLKLHVFAGCLTKEAAQNLQAETSSNLLAIQMDVTKDASIEKTMEIVKRTLPKDKGLWAVVNNAGILGGLGTTDLHSRQDYEKTLAVNLYGVVMVTKACMPLIVKEKGRVVNTSSILGRLALLNASYCISKFGVEAFSDVLRRENYRTGVTVQIVEPSAFKTPILARQYVQKMAEAKMASLPADIKARLPKNALELVAGSAHVMGEKASTDTGLVVDAYVHAITAKYPKKRYQAGYAAKYMFRLLWIVPECMSDFFIDRMFGKYMNLTKE